MKTEQIRHHFQVQVPNYSGLMQRLIPFYDTQRDVMLGLMPLDRDAPLRVLDLGVWARSIAARVLAEFARAELTLIDLTPEMIDESRSRLSAFDRVDYRVADFRRHPVPVRHPGKRVLRWRPA